MNIKEHYKQILNSQLNENDHPIGRFSSASEGVSDIKREIAKIKRRMSPDGNERERDPNTDEFDRLERRLKELHKQLKGM
jgi:hypothetical protein